MKRTIRQVFGTTRPKDIFGDLLTFEKLITRPIVHIVYWVGLGLLVIGAFAVLGISVGTAIKEGPPWGFLLALPFLIVGWLSILIAILLWRSFCEFYLAVMSIADDLRHLREYQDKREGLEPSAPPVIPLRSKAAAQAAAAPVTTDPFEAPVAETAAVEGQEDILEHPFFSPRYKPE